MSVYTVPALNAVDFALTVHTVPSIVSPANALQSYTVPALSAVDFALSVYTPPTYMDIGWELTPSGGGAVTGTLTLSTEASVDATAVLGFIGALTLSAEAAVAATAALGIAGTVTLATESYVDATGIGGISVVTHPRTIVRSLFPQRAATPTGTLTLALARPPRGARTPSRLIPQ